MNRINNVACKGECADGVPPWEYCSCYPQDHPFNADRAGIAEELNLAADERLQLALFSEMS